MSGEAFIRLEKSGGGYADCGRIISAVFSKDLYSPYSQLRGSVMLESRIGFSDIRRVAFYVGGKRVHYGLPDLLRTRVCGGRVIMNVVSRGITLLLGQNEPEPGIWSQVSLTEIMDRYSPLSEIGFESGTKTVNYVNINERSTLWEALGVYGVKAYGHRAYIGGDSLVRVTFEDAVAALGGKVIIDYGNQLDTSLMLSKLYMKNVNGEYGYSYEDDRVQPFGIVREKYYNLDRQWLNDVTAGLKDRVDFADREYLTNYLTYVGYGGEDVGDIISAVGYGCNGGRICRLEITADNAGVRTKVSAEAV